MTMKQSDMLAILKGNTSAADPNRGVEYQDVLFGHYFALSEGDRAAFWKELLGALKLLWMEHDAVAFHSASAMICRMAGLEPRHTPPKPEKYFDFIAEQDIQVGSDDETRLSLAADAMRLLQSFELKNDGFWRDRFEKSLAVLKVSNSSAAPYCVLYSALGLLQAESRFKNKELLDLLLSAWQAAKFPKLEIYSILKTMEKRIDNGRVKQLVEEEYQACLDTFDAGDTSENSEDFQSLPQYQALKKVIDVWRKEVGAETVDYRPASRKTPRSLFANLLAVA